MNKKGLLEAAQKFGTPLYIFDIDVFNERAIKVREAFSKEVGLCFSIKANPFLVGSIPSEFSYLEVCSPGEMNICKQMNIKPEKIILSGVNKAAKDIEEALDYGVSILTAESPLHFKTIAEAAEIRNIKLEVLLRLTGGDQFGMDEKDIRELIAKRKQHENIEITGLHYFTGTQKKNAKVIEKELNYLSDFSDNLFAEFGFKTHKLEYGAGLFSDYYSDNPEESELKLLSDVSEYINNSAKRFELTVEMGRFFAASCGYYLSSVDDIKQNKGKNIAILDGGNHQMAYDGLMLSGKPPKVENLDDDSTSEKQWMLYGSLCSKGDIMARNAVFGSLELGDVLSFERTGAYSMTESMALFLSRDLPSVAVYSKKSGLVLIRGKIETYEMNMGQLQQ